MQPESQLPPAPPPMDPNQGGHSSYDFIFNPQEKAKKSFLPSGSSKNSRILIAIIGGAVLLGVILMIVSLFFSSNKSGTESLVAAAQQQTELIRIADIGTQKARTTAGRNIAITTKLSLESEKAPLLAAIKQQGRNISGKELSAGKKLTTDKLLTNADQSNRFDEVFIEKIQADLVIYQKALKTAYDQATDKKAKQALSDQYKKASILAGVNPEN